MADLITKDEFSFLFEAMERKSSSQQGAKIMAAASPSSGDKVEGDMSIPKPVTVDSKGGMSDEDYKACSMIMSVCQNMIQKQIVDAAHASGIDTQTALKSLDAWVNGYVSFPFPFFNFKDTQSDVYKKDDFSLKADPEIVDKVVNIKNVPGLKDAVVGALKSSGGNLASYENTDRAFNYFGVITGYLEKEISMRVIKFQMNLKKTKVDSLCVHYQSTALDTSYDTYQFVADKAMMIAMQAKMKDQLVDYIAEKLLEFIKEFYDQQLKNYQEMLKGILSKSKKN